VFFSVIVKIFTRKSEKGKPETIKRRVEKEDLVH